MTDAQTESVALMRKVAIAAALIAGASVILASMLALRLVETRERAVLAAAQCTCCGAQTPSSPEPVGADTRDPGEVDGSRR